MACTHVMPWGHKETEREREREQKHTCACTCVPSNHASHSTHPTHTPLPLLILTIVQHSAMGFPPSIPPSLPPCVYIYLPSHDSNDSNMCMCACFVQCYWLHCTSVRLQFVNICQMWAAIGFCIFPYSTQIGPWIFLSHTLSCSLVPISIVNLNHLDNLRNCNRKAYSIFGLELVSAKNWFLSCTCIMEPFCL